MFTRSKWDLFPLFLNYTPVYNVLRLHKCVKKKKVTFFNWTLPWFSMSCHIRSSYKYFCVISCCWRSRVLEKWHWGEPFGSGFLKNWLYVFNGRKLTERALGIVFFVCGLCPTQWNVFTHACRFAASCWNEARAVVCKLLCHYNKLSSFVVRTRARTLASITRA